MIGPLFLVALGILASWLWTRNKRPVRLAMDKELPIEERKDDMIKAQLHADSMNVPRHELDGSTSPEPPSELPVLEPVGSELSATKKSFIRRKPVV